MEKMRRDVVNVNGELWSWLIPDSTDTRSFHTKVSNVSWMLKR